MSTIGAGGGLKVGNCVTALDYPSKVLLSVDGCNAAMIHPGRFMYAHYCESIIVKA